MIVKNLIVSTIFILMSLFLKINLNKDKYINGDDPLLYAVYIGSISFVLTCNIVNSVVFMFILYIFEKFRYKDKEYEYKRNILCNFIITLTEIICLAVLI